MIFDVGAREPAYCHESDDDEAFFVCPPGAEPRKVHGRSQGSGYFNISEHRQLRLVQNHFSDLNLG